MNALKFLFDGRQLSPTMTAEQVYIYLDFLKAGLENDDSIDAMLHQEGGKMCI